MTTRVALVSLITANFPPLLKATKAYLGLKRQLRHEAALERELRRLLRRIEEASPMVS
jgi:hypothetical protein